MSQENVALVRGIYDAYSRRDMEAFLGALDPQVEWRFADNFIYAQTNPLIGRETLWEGSLRTLAKDWRDFDSIPDELLDAGDQIVGIGHYVGLYKPTGKRIRAQFVHVWTIAGGKVTRWRQFVDTKQFCDALKG